MVLLYRNGRRDQGRGSRNRQIRLKRLRSMLREEPIAAADVRVNTDYVAQSDAPPLRGDISGNGAGTAMGYARYIGACGCCVSGATQRLTWPLTGRSEEMRGIEGALSLRGVKPWCRGVPMAKSRYRMWFRYSRAMKSLTCTSITLCRSLQLQEGDDKRCLPGWGARQLVRSEASDFDSQ